MIHGGTPILASSCAQATSTAEMRFRIDRPILGGRMVCVIALDSGADEIVRPLSQQPWDNARLMTLSDTAPTAADRGSESVLLCDLDGRTTALSRELDGTDIVVMVATTSADAAAAAIIGAACTVRAIMTAGVVIGERAQIVDTVHALRPHAQVLTVSADDRDVADLLRALRT